MHKETIMGAKLYWTTDSTTCANCGAQLSRTGRHLSVKRGSEPVPIWTCESCDMDFVQYQDNSAVIQFEKSVFCKYLPDFLGSTVKAIKDAEKRVKDVDSMVVDMTSIADGSRLPLAANYIEKYLQIEASADDIVDTFNDIVENMEETIRSRNIVILGQYGFGSVCIGEDFARSFYDMGVCSSKTIAKIKAAGLNKMSQDKLEPNMKKLSGGCLVVENAGLVAPEKLIEIVKLSAKDQYDFVVILTGEIDSISRLFGNTGEILSEFEYLIDVTKITKQEMTKIALEYIKQRGYKASSDVENKINNVLMGMEAGNLDRLIGVIDEAINKSDKRDDKRILHPDDIN